MASWLRDQDPGLWSRLKDAELRAENKTPEQPDDVVFDEYFHRLQLELRRALAGHFAFERSLDVISAALSVRKVYRQELGLYV